MNILLTGVTGFVGRRLAYSLIEDKNIKVRCLVRNKRKLDQSFIENFEIVEGDTFDLKMLNDALNDIDIAVYLIHMMSENDDYIGAEKKSAENFISIAKENGVKRIIYLGGLGKYQDASRHLRSRLMTGEVLSKFNESVKLIWFRTGVIIGSGSASFEILRNLVDKLPIMIAPKWTKTKTCPIYIDDVIKYLKAAIFLRDEINEVIDIGLEQMSFKEMILRTAKAMGLKRYIFTINFLTPRLSAYWLVFLTPVNFKIAKELIMGLKSETIKINENAKIYFPEIKTLDFETSVRKAIHEIEDNQVLSRWCDSSQNLICDVPHIPEISKAIYKESLSSHFTHELGLSVFEVCANAGGKNGWFALNFLWTLRGIIDKLFGGYGINRSRRESSNLRIGDAIDFWKLVDFQPGKRILLEAQMIIPGKGWLEFVINYDTLIQTAYYYPNGLGGRVYWYAMIPFHKIIFRLMIKRILTRAKILYERRAS